MASFHLDWLLLYEDVSGKMRKHEKADREDSHFTIYHSEVLTACACVKNPSIPVKLWYTWTDPDVTFFYCLLVCSTTTISENESTLSFALQP